MITFVLMAQKRVCWLTFIKEIEMEASRKNNGPLYAGAGVVSAVVLSAAVFFGLKGQNAPTAPAATPVAQALQVTPADLAAASAPAPQVQAVAPKPAARPAAEYKKVAPPKPAVAAAPAAAPVVTAQAPAPTQPDFGSAGGVVTPQVVAAPPAPPPVCPESQKRYLGQVAGGVAGAAAGAVVGNQIGGGSGKDAAQVILGGLGAYVGSQKFGVKYDVAQMNQEQQQIAAQTGCQPRVYSVGGPN